ncbi:response regulator [Paenibacillus sp. p3-SID1389]|uniref:response regulator n=1 Tax=Paenibacillus sp. p3-SID1389 TaxID=2916364 RepID=UPI0021A65C0D|nr:response regulator [Paenibacillus sp. p3-SID1389]MCT2193688.1 response regulator [Paenibacillus sp. p3-SID1389]
MDLLKVLIVDDEPSNIQGLVRYIRWRELGYEEPKTGESGEEALEAIRQTPFDVLISDVAMPGMNGIELVARAKELLPQLQVLMISGYNEFEFVQDAIHVGAQGYVLKPLKLEEVSSRLTAMRETVENMRRLAEQTEDLKRKVSGSQRLIQERVLSDLLAGLVPGEDRQASWDGLMKLPVGVRELNLFLFSLDHFLSLKQRAEERVVLSAALRQTVDVALSAFNSVWLAQTSPDEMVALQMNPTVEDKARMEKQLRFVQVILQEQHHSTVTIGCSPAASTWEELPDLYKEMKFRIAQARLIADGQIVRGETPDAGAFDDYRLREQWMPELIRKMEEGDAAAVRDTMNRVVDLLSGQPSFSYVQAVGMSFLSELIRTLRRGSEADRETNIVLWRRMLDCSSTEQIIEFLMECVDRYMAVEARERMNQQRLLIRKVAAFIDERVRDNWTVKQLGEQFNLNASYLSVLFKKEMGKTISEYVQETRIRQAKELLSDPNIKVYEVADRVGIQTSAYFTYLFKKLVGCTPQEFRDYR